MSARVKAGVKQVEYLLWCGAPYLSTCRDLGLTVTILLYCVSQGSVRQAQPMLTNPRDAMLDKYSG